MEELSPLAAIHRPRFTQPWTKKDPFVSLPRAAGTGGGMGLRERLHKPTPDYLNFKNVRGSSPAASLAADLSQNFRLDNDSSPRFATPRRNLFSAAVMMGAEGREYLATPEIASSSPLTMEDMLQDSPLPNTAHAPTFLDVEIMSPTQAHDDDANTPDVDTEDYDTNESSMYDTTESSLYDFDSMMEDSPAPVSRKASFELPRFSAADRRAPRRPSLSRKAYTSMVHTRGVSAESQLPYFRFGESKSSLGDPRFDFGDAKLSFGDSKLGRATSATSLGDSFENRPPQLTRPPSAGAVPASLRYRMPSFNGPSSSRNGSPAGPVRRGSNPFSRSRKHFRRSLSMFEHPQDVMKPKMDRAAAVCNVLESVADIEDVQEPKLPHFSSGDSGDTIPRISGDTLIDVLNGKYSSEFDHKMIIDCRFEYEYDGGHIDGAVNYNDKELLASHLFDTPMEGRTLIVLHCEYSAHRAPLIARHIRSQDRTVNAVNYPKLTYPDVYILSGGYSEFFEAHRCRCYPQNYIEMSDEKHQRTCERELGRLKARKQPTLSRARTFAFGATVEGSPFGKRRSFDEFSLGSPGETGRRTRIVTL
ncbi:related to protein-tyrosine-phosphatase [Cephalotrichum gorgonifer]|uniref:M-phase inducer phosphatase n=1 Tax=Cephalotrichum gorgonifer TaxID=2041049 RepID=A0AAE8MNQ6_9PEZI|nr:related to protein-tyrosine-phosphatase [Cephalotrichum gorgonifer]